MLEGARPLALSLVVAQVMLAKGSDKNIAIESAKRRGRAVSRHGALEGRNGDPVHADRLDVNIFPLASSAT